LMTHHYQTIQKSPDQDLRIHIQEVHNRRVPDPAQNR
jgi:hypothetical protein